MTPEQITAMTHALVSLLNATGATPVVALFLGVLLGPWLVLVIISVFQHRRFEAVVTMYNNNFQQVEKTQEIAKDTQELVGGYKEIIKADRELVAWTTTEMQGMSDAIRTNMYCPLVRKYAKPQDIHDGN